MKKAVVQKLIDLKQEMGEKSKEDLKEIKKYEETILLMNELEAKGWIKKAENQLIADRTHLIRNFSYNTPT